MRLRQAVLAARDLEATKAMLESHGLREPFRDPGVKEFGLDNAVYPVGDAALCRSAGLRRLPAMETGDAFTRVLRPA